MLLRYEEIDFELYKQVKKSEKMCTMTKKVGSQKTQRNENSDRVRALVCAQVEDLVCNW